MLRIVPHTVPRVGRSYECFPDGFELHLLLLIEALANQGCWAVAHIAGGAGPPGVIDVRAAIAAIDAVLAIVARVHQILCRSC